MWPLVALGAAIGTTIIGHFRTVNAIKKKPSTINGLKEQMSKLI